VRSEEQVDLPASCRVLLLGGHSGTGKSMVAKHLERRLGMSWIQVDDLRLALQRSRAVLPRNTEDLYYFLDTPDVWQQPPQTLRDRLIAVGAAMCPGVEVVVEHHVDQCLPSVIEGDGILPSIMARASVRKRVEAGHVRAAFLVEPDEEAILANMIARGRGFDSQTEPEQRTIALTSWLYGQWLSREAHRYSLPVVEPRPWETLPCRVLEAIR
jgi:2-phosphoglycerate kinase